MATFVFSYDGVYPAPGSQVLCLFISGRSCLRHLVDLCTLLLRCLVTTFVWQLFLEILPAYVFIGCCNSGFVHSIFSSPLSPGPPYRCLTYAFIFSWMDWPASFHATLDAPVPQRRPRCSPSLLRGLSIFFCLLTDSSSEGSIVIHFLLLGAVVFRPILSSAFSLCNCNSYPRISRAVNVLEGFGQISSLL